jgi:4-aminobutyrate aminotransferase-like enzyme
MSTATEDRQYLGRDLPAQPLEIVGADGAFLIDADGTKYLDFLMGWCVGNLGWGNETIAKKIRSFKGPTYVFPRFLYAPWAELARLLAEITPGKLTKSFRAATGTEAVEIALQAAMSHTKRHQFLSVEGSYHGHSIAALSVGGSEYRSWYQNLLPGCHKLEPPLDARAAAQAEKILGTREVAALIMEPIILNLGVLTPEREFMDRVRRACRSTGTLFIADEVATGFGRTGRLFASEHFGLEPDIMCLGKGLTGGYGALAATVMTEEVARSMEFGFSYYSTFGWSPLNVAAALANLQLLLKNQAGILENVAKMSEYFAGRLRKMKFRHPPHLRMQGLAIFIRFDERGYADSVARQCLAKHLLMESSPEMLWLCPPLTIDKALAKKGLDILESCL